MVPFLMTLSDLQPIVHGGVTIDALDVLRAYLTRHLFAIAKFLVYNVKTVRLSCLKRHNFDTFVDIKINLSTAAHM